MVLEHGPHNFGGLVHSGITQIFPPQNPILVQVIKNLPQVVVLKGENVFSLRNLDTQELWYLHPYTLESSSWSFIMTPVAYVQDFAFFLKGPSKFMLGVGSWCYWYPSPVYEKSQMSLHRTICLDWTIRLVVGRHQRLRWSVPRESQGTSGQTCFPRRLPLMNWIPPLWPSFTFPGSSNQRYSPCSTFIWIPGIH